MLYFQVSCIRVFIMRDAKINEDDNTYHTLCLLTHPLTIQLLDGSHMHAAFTG